MPQTMRAIAIREPGGPDMLVPETRPIPQPGAGEVLIRVAAAGVNRPDVLQRQGLYPAPPGASDLPGLEVAGEIVALGSGVRRWSVGDRVCALLSGGGYAEYGTALLAHCAPVPKGFSMVEAAAIPETFVTVWHNVFQRAALRGSDTLLVHGGTSGIGTTAIQLGRAFGHTVFATAGTDEKCAACRDLGAEIAINHRITDFVAAVKEATGGKGADVILDMVGGDYIQRNIKAAAVDGRIAQIAFLRGSKAEIDLMPLMLKRLTLTGSTMRSQPPARKEQYIDALTTSVWPLFEDRRVAPVIDSTFPLEEAAQAHARMETGNHIGKIVLEVG